MKSEMNPDVNGVRVKVTEVVLGRTFKSWLGKATLGRILSTPIVTLEISSWNRVTGYGKPDKFYVCPGDQINLAGLTDMEEME